MTLWFYTDVTVRRVYELWVHNKKKALPGETSLLRKVVPSIQTCNSGTYSYRNDVRCNRSSWKKNFPSRSVLLVPKYMQKGLDRQPLNPNIAHAFFRKMCFKYKQVSLHKHSSTLLRDCLYNQFNINYIANSTGIRFPEERIRNSPASEFTMVTCCPRMTCWESWYGGNGLCLHWCRSSFCGCFPVALHCAYLIR